MKTRLLGTLLLGALTILPGCARANDTSGNGVVPGIPVKDTVTVVDLGAKTCIPCKMMAPILEELQTEYRGKAAVIFIDVKEKENEGKAQAFKLMGIPTQIFFDRNGKEVNRHLGFMAKDDIKRQLDAMLGEK